MSSKVIALLLAIVVTGMHSRADFIVSVTAPSTVILPSSGTQEFTVSVSLATVSGSQNLRTYTIPVDIAPPGGTGLPSGWTVASVNQRFFGFTDPFPGFDKRGGIGDLAASEGDAVASHGNIFGAAVSFNTAPVALFDLTMRVDSSASAGQYTASIFNTGALFLLTDADGATIPAAQLQFQSATIDAIRAVPEPTNALFAIAAINCLVLKRRRITASVRLT